MVRRRPEESTRLPRTGHREGSRGSRRPMAPWRRPTLWPGTRVCCPEPRSNRGSRRRSRMPWPSIPISSKVTRRWPGCWRSPSGTGRAGNANTSGRSSSIPPTATRASGMASTSRRWDGTTSTSSTPGAASKWTRSTCCSTRRWRAALAQLGRHDEAVAQYRRTLDLEPRFHAGTQRPRAPLLANGPARRGDRGGPERRVPGSARPRSTPWRAGETRPAVCSGSSRR